MGKASFAHIQDATGELQLYFKRNVLGDTQYEYFKFLDVGDIVGAEGSVFKTRTGRSAFRSSASCCSPRRIEPFRTNGMASRTLRPVSDVATSI